MQVLDLFSGVGGFALGLERAGFTTAAFCEIEDYPSQVLAKNWPGIPIYNDVRTLTHETLQKDGINPQVIVGGYPCQPFSGAGLRQGRADPRHLWPEFYRLVKDIRPRWVIAENVIGHVSLGLPDVMRDLEFADYRVWAFTIPAAAVGARHMRDRVWIVGQRHARAVKSENGWQCLDCHQDVFGGCECDHGERVCRECGEWTYPYYYEVVEGCAHCGADWHVPDADSERGRLWAPGQQDADHAGQSPQCTQWDERGIESRVDRVADGVPNRAHRVNALGNAVCPLIPELIGRSIMRVEEELKR